MLGRLRQAIAEHEREMAGDFLMLDGHLRDHKAKRRERRVSRPRRARVSLPTESKATLAAIEVLIEEVRALRAVATAPRAVVWDDKGRPAGVQILMGSDEQS